MVAMWLGYDGREKSNQLAAANAHTRALQQRSDELGRALTFLRDPETRPAVSRRGGINRGAHSLSILDPVGCSSPRICLPWPRAAYMRCGLYRRHKLHALRVVPSRCNGICQRLIARQPAISPADAIGRGSARPSQRLEAQTRENERGANIPRIRKHEDPRPVMKRTEALALFF